MAVGYKLEMTPERRVGVEGILTWHDTENTKHIRPSMYMEREWGAGGGGRGAGWGRIYFSLQ